MAQAILFDMDGVLADVGESYRRCIVEAAAALGVEVTPMDIRAAKAAQSERDVLVLPPTPSGHVPELQLEEGHFKAYRFRSLKEETAWIPDSGSSRIDAVLERHFAQGDLS